MKIINIQKSKEEAQKFLSILKEVEEDQFRKGKTSTTASKETGALKRSSMDLTRALSEMRNDTY